MNYLSINDTAETSLTCFSGCLPYYSRSAEHIYTSHFLTLSPMISNTKGCWSCRARRKRCDGKTPRCNTCDRLGIDCAGFETIRPSWMDGGAEQRAYCGWLKKVVKSARRQQIHTQRKSNSDSSSDLSQAQQLQQWLASPTSAMEVVVPETAPCQVRTLWTDAGASSSSPKADQRTEYWLNNSLNWETDTKLLSHGVNEGNLGSLDYTISEGDLDLLITEAEQHQPSILSPAPEIPNFSKPSQGNADREPDWLLLMRYFDYTMQRLFPFHCPIEHLDVRAYMLHVAHRSSVVSTALMSAVLFDLERVPTAAQPQDANSEASVTSPRCLTYYRRASEMILSELETLFNDKNHTAPICRHNQALEALVCLVHLLLLGVSLSKSSPRRLVGATTQLIRLSGRSQRRRRNEYSLQTRLSTCRASRFYIFIPRV